jgi:ATP-dependent RNA helicase RhlB
LRFHDLDLPPEIMHAIFKLGFQYCTPIQAEILPSTLAGKDATGRAQTGTGKTAAFLISIFTTLLRNPLEKKSRTASPRALILAPTRELAMQITEEAKLLSEYSPFRTLAVFGGVDYEKQRRELRQHVIDVLVATPGRLLDYHHQGELRLNQVEILVIDEADRMLDMGFVPDVRKIIHCTPPKNLRQTLLFSATLSSDVLRLASQWTKNPIQVEIEPEHVATDSVKQVVYITTTDSKLALLYNLITNLNLERVLVFCNRRDETRTLTELLRQYSVNCALISGEIAQTKRTKTLEDFKSGEIRVLVATDVAGRGLHIEGISHVVNFTLPHDPEDYVHRIGRTGRAGATGTSISFACEEDSFYIPAIETFLGESLHCIHPDDDWLILPPFPKKRISLKSPDSKEKHAQPRRGRPRPGGSGKPRETGHRRSPRTLHKTAASESKTP